jgi:hypothetical protein
MVHGTMVQTPRACEYRLGTVSSDTTAGQRVIIIIMRICYCWFRFPSNVPSKACGWCVWLELIEKYLHARTNHTLPTEHSKGTVASYLALSYVLANCPAFSRILPVFGALSCTFSLFSKLSGRRVGIIWARSESVLQEGSKILQKGSKILQNLRWCPAKW